MYFYPADILLPQEDVNPTQWSVVACDQYTSQPDYWAKVEELVGAAPSTLRLIFPEAYLGQGNKQERIDTINATMAKYQQEGVFKTLKNSYILLERTMENGAVRRGLMGCIDLDEYSFTKGKKPLIRATEGTVLERIPPRVEIRKAAPLELPHIMLLIDDPDRTVIEPLFDQAAEVCYDFDLMQRGGHSKGYVVHGDKAEALNRALAPLADPDRYEKDGTPFLFAVGDGNHSLATAKTCWDLLKETLTPEEQQCHPARFALVELVNVHDEALVFEPIHRIVLGCDPKDLMQKMQAFTDAQTGDNVQTVTVCQGGKQTDFIFPHATDALTVGTLQRFLDQYGKGEIDYIHGDDVVMSLSEKDDAIGFLLPAMDKGDLFRSVVFDGALPRKTFSMGEAHEKRFYLEARALF
ncbi:MAG: DUF1015 domain-containing protein [Clostridia bacterium]|nr:DUF1015 domain-containing protein [Clostridia bacterium]